MNTIILGNYLDELASSSPTPSGGGVSAMVASLSAALFEMVINISLKKKNLEGYHDEFKKDVSIIMAIRDDFYTGIRDDEDNFKELLKAYKAKGEEKEELMRRGLEQAIRTPILVIDGCKVLTNIMKRLHDKLDKSLSSDFIIVLSLIRATIVSSIATLLINIKLMDNNELIGELRRMIDSLNANELPTIDSLNNKIMKELNE